MIQLLNMGFKCVGTCTVTGLKDELPNKDRGRPKPTQTVR